MTDSEWLAYVRSLLNEPTAKFWTDAELLLYKSVHIRTVFSRFWNLLYPTKKKFALVSVTSGSHEFDFPADCYKPGKLEIAQSGERLCLINESQLYHYDLTSSDTPRAWMLFNGKGFLTPAPNFTSATYYRLWYMPKPTQLSDLPEELHPLVAIEAALDARGKDEETDPTLERKRDRLEDAATHALAVSQLQAPDQMCDESIDDGEGY